MEISRMNMLRGPNYWTSQTAAKAVVICDENECCITQLDGFEKCLREYLPSINLDRSNDCDQSISVAHTLERVALELQVLAGCPVKFSCTQRTLEPGVYQVVVQYIEEEVGSLALDLAEHLCQCVIDQVPFDIAHAVQQLEECLEDACFGESTQSIVDAALARHIPYQRLTTDSSVQLGWGSRQRRIQAAEADQTSSIAESVAQGKDLTLVGEEIINEMFEEGNNGRIPLVAVTGVNGKTTTVRLISQLMKQSGLRVGMTTTDGVYIDGRCIDTGDCSGPKSARKVLLDPTVDVAVLETARGGIIREGLAFDYCDVAVVTNIGMGDHLGIGHIHTLEDLAAVKSVVVQNMKETGVAVLNAADPVVVSMAPQNSASIIYFASNGQHPIIAKHYLEGHRVIYIHENNLVAAHGSNQVAISLTDIPITHNGAIGFQVENAMASVAAAWGLGLKWDDIRVGLQTFSNEMHSSAGRFNLFNYRGATVIADYGHNHDAITALIHAVETIPAKRRVVVISGTGDRRDTDNRQQTVILGDAFDVVVLYQGSFQRGREDGAVMTILREGLANARRTTVVEEIRGQILAIDTALSYLNEGDLCLILIEAVDEALGHIAQCVSS